MVGVLLAACRGELRDAARRLRRHRPRRRRGGAGVVDVHRRGGARRRRAQHVGTAQLAWSIGPMVGFALAIAVVPLGLLGSRLIFLHLFVVAFVTWWLRQGLSESRLWTEDRDSGPVASGHRWVADAADAAARNITAMLFLFGVYGFWNLVAGQAGIFMPRVYDAAGFSSATGQNALQVLVWGCTCLATFFGFMRFADTTEPAHPLRHRCRDGRRGLGPAHAMPRVAGRAARVRGRLGHLGRHRRPGVLQRVDQRAVRHALPRHRAGRPLLRSPGRGRRCSATCSRRSSPSRASRSWAR